MAAGSLSTAEAATRQGGGGGSSREGLGRTHLRRDELQGLSGASQPPHREISPGVGPAGRGATRKGHRAAAAGAGAGSIPMAGTGNRTPGETRRPRQTPMTTPQGRGTGGAGTLMTDTLQGPSTMSPQRGARHTRGKTLIPPDNGTQEGGKPGADPTGEARTTRQASRERCPVTSSQTRGAGGAGMLTTHMLQGPSTTPPGGGAGDTRGKTGIPPGNSIPQGAKPGADPTGEARTPGQPPGEWCPTTTPQGRGSGGAGMLTRDELQGPGGTSRAPQGGVGTGAGTGAVPGTGTRSPPSQNGNCHSQAQPRVSSWALGISQDGATRSHLDILFQGFTLCK